MKHLQLRDNETEKDVEIRISLDPKGFVVLCDYSDGTHADEYVRIAEKDEELL